jgi:hypothetical protein
MGRGIRLVGLAVTLIVQRSLAVTPLELQIATTATFNNPVAIGNAADSSGRLFIVEQAGRIRILQGSTVLSSPFLDISSLVNQDSITGQSERGLLGLAFHPAYKTNGQFYVYFTNPNASSNVIARFTASPPSSNTVNTNTMQTVLRIAHPSAANHNGGQLAFGTDGYLYAGTGDGGGACDSTGNNAQNRSSLLGKLLRLDVNNFSTNYTIPPSNPFVSTNGARPEIWAYGLRNPWRFSFDRGTGDLWIADVGQALREEVDFQPANSAGGQNYGWRCYEGFLTNTCGVACSNYPSVLPIFHYDHSSNNCTIIGGYRYRGTRISGLYGDYVYGDYCSGRIWTATPNGNSYVIHEVIRTPLLITTFGEDESGELYVAALGASASIYRFIEGPRIVSIQTSGSNVVIQITTNPGQNYRAERTDDLTSGTWTAVGSGSFMGIGGTNFVTDPGAAELPRLFYRALWLAQ